MKKALIGFVLLFAALAGAVFSNGDNQFFRAKNLLINPGFEYGLSYWGNKNGGSLTTDPTTAGFGATAATFLANGAYQSLGASLVTVPQGLYNGNCVASMLYKGGDTNLVFAIENNSGSSLATKTLANNANYARSNLGFTCPTSGSFRPVIYSTASATRIYIDDFYLGEDTGSSVLQETNWYVDATISGADPDLTTGSVTSYTGIEHGSLTLTNNSGSLTAQIPCSSTNASTGTTCSSGNESVGVVFNLPQSGPVIACVTFTHSAIIPTTAFTRFQTGFQIVETPNAAQTITTEGKSKTMDNVGQNTTAGTAQTVNYPHHNCSLFNFSSSGQKTLRLFYEQEVLNGTPTSSNLIGNGSASAGSVDIRWIVYPVR